MEERETEKSKTTTTTTTTTGPNEGLKRCASARRFAMSDVLEGVNQCDILLLNLDYEVKQEKRVEVQKCIEERAFDKALDNVIQVNRRLGRTNSAEKQFINETETISTIMDELDNELEEMIENEKGKRVVKQRQNILKST